MITIVVEIEHGLLTEFRANRLNVQLLVVDKDAETIGADPVSLRELPRPLTTQDSATIAAILKANAGTGGGAPAAWGGS
jgi:hypothetical protein